MTGNRKPASQNEARDPIDVQSVCIAMRRGVTLGVHLRRTGGAELNDILRRLDAAEHRAGTLFGALHSVARISRVRTSASYRAITNIVDAAIAAAKVK